MTRRLPILIVAIVLVALLGFMWKSLGGSSPAAEVDALAGPSLEVGLSPNEGTSEELASAPEVAEAPEASQRAVAAPEKTPVEATFSLPDDSLWIEGRVVFPDKLPLDEEFEVEARGRRFGEDRKAPREHRVSGTPNGRFRVAFAQKTKKGWLDVDARYMYLPARVKVEPKQQVGELLVEPLLGGVLRGVVAPPPGHEPNAETFEGVRVNVNEWRNDSSFRESTQVAADGSFEFRGIAPSGDYNVSLDSSRFAGEERDEIAVGAGEVTELELALSLGVHLSGVVSSSSGTPLENVTINMLVTREEHGGSHSMSRDEQTDEQGKFEFSGLQPGSVTLTIRAKDSAEIVDELGPLEDGARRDDLLYEPASGLSISGIVNWDDGEPAADVTVKARPIENDGDLEWNAREYLVKTDKAGRFELGGLDERKLVIDASGRRALERQEGEPSKRRRKQGPVQSARAEDIEPGTRGVALVLTEGELVRGSVVFANGQPVGRFWVTAQPDWDDRGALSWQDRVERSFDSEDGEFELSGLKPGSWNISAKGKNFAETEDQTIRVPFEGRIDLVVQQAASVSGSVRSPAGEPVAGAEITKVMINGSNQSWTSGDAKTNSKGEFKILSMVPGEYQLYAQADGFAPSARFSLTLAPAEARENVALTMSNPCHVTGVVLAGAGEVANRRISVYGGENWTHENATSDERGRFELTTLGPGEYQAQLNPDSATESDWQVNSANMPSVSFELVAGGTAHIELGAGPKRPIRVHGLVTSGGSPATDYVVHVNGGDPNNQGAARTDGNGAYALEVDGPGNYSATVRPAGADFGVNYLVFSMRIEAGSDHERDFDLPTASIELTILRPDGTPGAQVLVGVEAVDVEGLAGNVSQDQSADSEGRFAFKHLEPGTYIVRAGGSHPWGEDGGDYARQLLELKIGAGQRIERTLRMEEGAIARGTATWSDGTPAAGQLVRALDSQGRQVSSQWLSTDSGGSFTLKGLPKGSLTIIIGVEDSGQGQANARLSPGVETDVNIVVER